MSLRLRDSIDQELTPARRYAQQGNAEVMLIYLDKAWKMRNFGLERITEEDTAAINAEVRGIYAEVTSSKLASARDYARKGNVTLCRVCLELAQSYARGAKQDISREVEEIRAGLGK